ncbi:NAD-dependent epimerase/dehydratase family protein [Actinopolyspora saharensis]|uniref:Nucleoside-diphosphate-sugar epimerase n=1 Tax=Actinopolyspora saharensis TaxID=995062 RepID=A0A1H0Z990_9ACTN|nr:NAD-dependent epimerase/dehydratase family protein [Actinopolyspora saharensis]SDQ23993.1 Nucleoside-diphosphate-sugar epimerase [Actinopolyspora saharensis]
MTVLLAGCGDLGTEAGLRFAAAGRDVIGLRRSTHRLPPGITGQSVDLTRELPSVPADTAIVVIVLTADRRDADGYRRTYADGTRNVLDAIDRAGISPRILFVSSTAVYGATEGWVDETTPTAPSSETGAVLAETERMLHERRPDAVVLRLAGLYGPGRTSLVDRVRAGTAESSSAPRYTNRIHRDDAAAAIVHLTTEVAHPDPVYVGVDHRPAERAEVLDFLAAELDVPGPASNAPAAGRPADKCFRNDLLLATGFEFTHPTYREGYRAVLSGRGVRHH